MSWEMEILLSLSSSRQLPSMRLKKKYFPRKRLRCLNMKRSIELSMKLITGKLVESTYGFFTSIHKQHFLLVSFFPLLFNYFIEMLGVLILFSMCRSKYLFNIYRFSTSVCYIDLYNKNLIIFSLPLLYTRTNHDWDSLITWTQYHCTFYDIWSLSRSLDFFRMIYINNRHYWSLSSHHYVRYGNFPIGLAYIRSTRASVCSWDFRTGIAFVPVRPMEYVCMLCTIARAVTLTESTIHFILVHTCTSVVDQQ